MSEGSPLSPTGDNPVLAASEVLETASSSVGQQLRSARDERGITLDEVAKSLKLSVRQIEAVEADDWQSLPCKTIIRGFVRNYARLMNLDPDPLMRSLDGIEMPSAPELKMVSGPPVNLASESKVDRRDYVRVLSGLVILGLAVLVTFLFPKDIWESTVSAFRAAMKSNETVVEQVAPETPQPAVEQPAADTASASIAAPVADATPAEPNVPTTVSPSAATPTDAPAQPSSPVGILKFGFEKPAWIEVRDSKGEILISQLNPAGTQRDVEGTPPFAVIIGNAGHVTLQYKGQAVDLSKRSKDDVARLNLE